MPLIQHLSVQMLVYQPFHSRLIFIHQMSTAPRYSGSLQKVAALFVERIRSRQHPKALEDGLAALTRRFGDDKYGQGYEKVGAVCYARFYTDFDDDENEIIAKQRYASGLVQRLLAEITKQQLT